jgi:hypothetical protein
MWLLRLFLKPLRADSRKPLNYTLGNGRFRSSEISFEGVLAAMDSVGRNFYLADAAKRKQQPHTILGRVL